MSKIYKILFLLLFFVTTLSIVSFENKQRKEASLIFLDVGQGDATIIDNGQNKQILIDGGNGDRILEKLGKYMPFYDKKVEVMISTHSDKDHIGGLIEVLKYYEVGQILENGVNCDTSICNEWRSLIEKKNVPVKKAEFGQKISIANIRIDILFPAENIMEKKFESDNETSIVAKVKMAKNTYLLTGDAGFVVEEELMKKNVNIKASVLKISHHGSKNSTSNKFLKEVNPQNAVISVGKNNYGHPSGELLNRLINMNIEIYRTDEQGDIVFYQ